MEYINKVELLGLVGNSRTTKVQNQYFVRFTLATNIIYKSSDGTVTIETTWHQITQPTKEEITYQKGEELHVIGRIRNTRYTDADGNERTIPEVIATEVERFIQNEKR